MVIVYLTVGPLIALLSFISLINYGLSPFTSFILGYLVGTVSIALIAALHSVICRGPRKVKAFRGANRVAD